MDLVAGNVNLGTMTWTSASSQIRAGRLVPIAVTASATIKEFPDLPTFGELGFPDLTALTWFGLSGPAGLPHGITQQLNAAVAEMLEQPPVKQRLDRDAVETRTMSAQEFTAFVVREIDKWAPIAKRAIGK
jgi:tripartite-type tricarboxylate transporter receptor subunit TctC